MTNSSLRSAPAFPARWFPTLPLSLSVGLGLLLAAPSLSSATVTIPVRSAASKESTSATPALETALAAARSHHLAHPDDTVVLRLPQGRIELDTTLRLTQADSNLVLAGSGSSSTGRNPTVLAGSTRLTGWHRNPSRSNLWEVTVPEVTQGKRYFNQLFVNGTRAQRTRFPKQGFLRTAGALSTGKPIELPFRPGDLRAAWTNDSDIRVVILMKWTDLHLPIRALDFTRNVARLDGGPRDFWMDEPDARYWIENAEDTLEEPGEWHLNRRTGLLRYLAPRGIDPNRDVVSAPRLTQLVSIEGTGEAPVRNLVFRDLVFSESDYEMPEAGLISPQAAVVIPGAVKAHHAIAGRFEKCRFDSLGGYGLELGRGSQRWTVSHCTFANLAAGGIRVGEPSDSKPSPQDANHTHQILDNTLEHLGRIFAPGVGILVFHSGTNHILHNRISDLFYTGISVGWNWGYQETPCRENEIAYNLVERVGQGRLSDMGGIYTLGPQPGTHIHHNLFRDITSYGYGGWGLYTDEGSTGILLENNVVYRCKDAGFHQHYGRDNLIRNNLFAFNQEHQLMRTRAEAHRSFWLTRNVVVWNHGDLLGSDWSGTTNHFQLDANLFWDTRLGTDAAAYKFQKKSWDAWRAQGQDPHSLIADPLLRDIQRPELGLLPSSPAYSLGFQPIDLSTVGPRKE